MDEVVCTGVCCAMIYGVVTLGGQFCYHSNDVKAIDVSAGLFFTPSSNISPEYYHNGSSWFRDITDGLNKSEHMVV